MGADHVTRLFLMFLNYEYNPQENSSSHPALFWCLMAVSTLINPLENRFHFSRSLSCQNLISWLSEMALLFRSFGSKFILHEFTQEIDCNSLPTLCRGLCNWKFREKRLK